MGDTKDRTIDGRTVIAGRLLRHFRMLRPRRSGAGRRDHTCMTVGELLAAYCEVEEQLTHERRWRGESFIHRIERGQEQLTLVRLAILEIALGLKPWERALLEEVAGFRGLLRRLIDELGVEVPDIREQILRETCGEIAVAEFEFIIEEWVKAAKQDVMRRLTAEAEATVRAALEVELADRVEREVSRRLDELNAAREQPPRGAKLRLLQDPTPGEPEDATA